MTGSKLYELGLVPDTTIVHIRDAEMHQLASGNWYQDHILNYMNRELESFTWQDDDNIYLDLK